MSRETLALRARRMLMEAKRLRDASTGIIATRDPKQKHEEYVTAWIAGAVFALDWAAGRGSEPTHMVAVMREITEKARRVSGSGGPRTRARRKT